jgi:hypothetical protein
LSTTSPRSSIALFYSAGASIAWPAAAVGLVAVVVVIQRVGVRLLVPYGLAAGGVWIALHEAGIHPTIAGAVLGFLTPAVAFHAREAVSPLARMEECSTPGAPTWCFPCSAGKRRRRRLGRRHRRPPFVAPLKAVGFTVAIFIAAPIHRSDRPSVYAPCRSAGKPGRRHVPPTPRFHMTTSATTTAFAQDA